VSTDGAADARAVVSTTSASYRPELQGLRALAVGLVVVYHVWVNRVSGGVDVFFLVSGFLLTGQLVRAAERGELDVRRQWSRAVLRLVPVAAVVLVCTAVASALVLPSGRWSQTLREVLAAMLFLENWQLAADSVDYAARHNAASPVQQFWSLSVQGQFFLLWPLLIALVALACRSPREVRRRVTVVLLIVIGMSLVYSIELTASAQPLAYFHTLTRLWEFAAGGLLALHGHRVAAGRRARVLAGWAGVVGLVSCGIALPVAAVFPGWAALWPTGSAALVLVAGRTGSGGGVDRLLSSPVARYLGDISYPLYLWHWPLLVFHLQAGQHEDVAPGSGAAIVAGSLGLAAITHHLVEKPVLRQRVPTAALVPTTGSLAPRYGAAAMVSVLLATGTWQVVIAGSLEAADVYSVETHPGARALRTGPIDPAPLLPPPVTVYEDWVRIERWDCAPMAGFPMDVCTQPVPTPADDGGSPEAPGRRIVVVGDSHAQQLTGALIPLAEQNNWQLITIIRGACPFSTASEVVPDEPDCLAWNAAAADEIIALRPDAVVTLATRDARVGVTEQTPPGFVEQWRRLDAVGIPVLALRDNPRFDHSIPDCVQHRPEDVAGCGANRTDIYAPDPPWTALEDLPANVTFVDIADAVCDQQRCPPVIGNVLVYLDDNHLTATFTASMADLLADQVHQGLGW
jgi:peptidoglycan/LPS O-acetylase OafA/YrhL